MSENSIPVLYAYLRRFTRVVVEKASQNIASLHGDLVQVGGLLMRESSALCLDEGGHGYNTGCIQSAYAPSVVR